MSGATQTQQAPQAAQGALGSVADAASNLTGGLTGSENGSGHQGSTSSATQATDQTKSEVSKTTDSAKDGNALDGATGAVSSTTESLSGTAKDTSGNAKDTVDKATGQEGQQGDEEKQKKEAELANQIGNVVQDTLDKIKPTLKTIVEHLDQADRDRQSDQLDEEKVIYAVKPLIESATGTLQECHGAIKSLDSDGMLQKRAQANVAKREATPEEYRLSDLLKDLTENVTKTIDESKRRLQDMPKAKKDLSPLLDLMGDPLFQILSAVGLLLNGVLGLLGNLLGGLGLGGIFKNLTNALGLDKMLGGGK